MMVASSSWSMAKTNIFLLSHTANSQFLDMIYMAFIISLVDQDVVFVGDTEIKKKKIII